MSNLVIGYVSGGTQSGYGIDAGGSSSVDVSGNYLVNCRTGINIGGSQNCRVSSNYITQSTYYAVVIYNVETDGVQTQPFPTPCSNIVISDNDILVPDGSEFGGGILILDAAQGVAIINNRITMIDSNPGNAAQAVLALTDSYLVSGNVLNGVRFPTVPNPSSSGGLQVLQFPDIADGITVASSSSAVQTIQSFNAGDYSKYVTFVKVTAGGTGYTSIPTVVFTAAGKVVATATATVSESDSELRS